MNMTPEQIAAIKAQLETVRFLGRPTRVVPKLRDVLARVEAHLASEHQTTAPDVPFALWHNVHSVGGFRAGAGNHGRGLAIDVDVTPNPYIATRTGKALGGEAAGAKLILGR
jgi:hypothetical protein